MMGHISCPNILSDDTPASLSYDMCTKLVKEKMGFQGLLITDGMGMGAVKKGEIKKSRIDRSVSKIIAKKLQIKWKRVGKSG